MAEELLDGGDAWGGGMSEVGSHVQSIYKNAAEGWDKNRNPRASHDA
jgi:hypothetical protein